MKANILGTEHKIVYKNYEDDPEFVERGICGYCDSIEHIICIGNIRSFPDWKNEKEERCKKFQKKVLRHEIIHAFLAESGLQESTGVINNIGWSQNEEMVDFFAIQFPKIQKVFKELNIDKE